MNELEQTRLALDDEPAPDHASSTFIAEEAAGLPMVERAVELRGPAVAEEEAEGPAVDTTVAGVLRNRRFLALWLAQVASQIGGNMVLFGLTVLVSARTNSNSAVSLLILSFLVPAVVFSALAGVYVDRLQLLAANSLFTLTLQASFAIGFALLGPLVVGVTSVNTLIILVAGLYFGAAVLCFILPPAPVPH